MNKSDEFLVPDYDSTEYKTREEYLEELKKAYDPHGLIIQSHREVNRIAREMLAYYSTGEVYRIADEARAFHGLAIIERKTQ